MKLRAEILRRQAGGEPYLQTFIYEPADEAETAASMLTNLNARKPLRDADGKEASPIRWECSCLQKKCGACAMRINGVPGLACDVKLSACGERIRLEPLRKFPVVADLIVNRDIMRENLIRMHLWLEQDALEPAADQELAYDASRCLQCGICLEVCPNYYGGGPFTGLAAAVPAARVLQLEKRGDGHGSEAERKTGPGKEKPKLFGRLRALTGEKRALPLARAYEKQVFEGCGKSLACRNICPAGIDADRLLASSNAVAVWKRLRSRKAGRES